MLSPLQVSIAGYDPYDAYQNHHILRKLTEIDNELPFISRGNLVLANLVNPISPDFHKEIYTWLHEHSLNILNLCREQFSHPSLTLFVSSPLNCDTYMILVFSKDNLTYDIFSRNHEDAIKLTDLLEQKFKGDNKSVGGNIKFAFWQHDDDDDCDATTSNKKCPTLDEIRKNYSPALMKRIDTVISLREPYLHGKIILYHGKSGNGKTFLIRALARMWNEMHGVIPEVIIDPEQLYENPRYITSLLVNGSNRIYTSKVEPPFRLIIAEDCAQLFSTDSRSQTGFSRLLNTVDGLLGQDQKIIFVFTANEQINEIDPAILRAGRCLQNLEVPSWNRKQALEWIGKHDATISAGNLPNEISLAEMYAIIKKTVHADQLRNTLGF